MLPRVPSQQSHEQQQYSKHCHPSHVNAACKSSHPQATAQGSSSDHTAMMSRVPAPGRCCCVRLSAGDARDQGGVISQQQQQQQQWVMLVMRYYRRGPVSSLLDVAMTDTSNDITTSTASYACFQVASGLQRLHTAQPDRIVQLATSSAQIFPAEVLRGTRAPRACVRYRGVVLHEMVTGRASFAGSMWSSDVCWRVGARLSQPVCVRMWQR
jgi:hypothetical protein